MKDKYITYKHDFKNYIILIKSGNFYVALEDDALIMNRVFNYKIKEFKNFIKIGFPFESLTKIKDELYRRNINYIVIENEIIDKEKFKNNKYDDYLKSNVLKYKLYLNRVNNINNILKNNIVSEEVISEIEGILCKIGY